MSYITVQLSNHQTAYSMLHVHHGCQYFGNWFAPANLEASAIPPGIPGSAARIVMSKQVTVHISLPVTAGSTGSVVLFGSMACLILSSIAFVLSFLPPAWSSRLMSSVSDSYTSSRASPAPPSSPEAEEDDKRRMEGGQHTRAS